MDWIKRNLYFLIGGAVALALMGMAGYFLYSKWSLNNEEMEKLNQDYTELGQLNNADPHPGFGQVNNIKLAQEQTEGVQKLIEKARATFVPIPPIPQVSPAPDAPTNEPPKVSDRDFSAALSRTIDYLQKTATNASVVLPPNYLFSFSSQNGRVSFDPGSPTRLAVQLGEVKTICDILFAAKVNSIDNIRRERVSKDDSTGGNLSDYFEKKSVTNDLAIVSPYEVTFRCFSPELAAVLAGFASSPHGIIVKSINTETVAAPTTSPEEQMAAPMYTGPMYVPTTPGGGAAAEQQSSAAAFARRYGLGAGGGRGGGRYGGSPMTPAAPTAPTQPMYVPSAPTQPAKTGPQAVLDEKQLKVTLSLSVVKLLPKQEAAS